MRRVYLALLALVIAGFGAAIIFGGPGTPKAMESIADPFRSVDFSDLPSVSQFTARDGTKLAYRVYLNATGGAGKGSAVLIHGSSATSSSMHPFAKSLAAAGYSVYALDVRGHGSSGTKGQIAYVGQLEDDLADFMRSVSPAQPATLIGFSSGAGFAVRFAGSGQQQLFQSYLFLAPFLSENSPTLRPDAGGWASVGVPRIIAIAILNRFGVHAFNSLPVLRFGITEEEKAILTPEYSYSLTTNFRPDRDYLADLRAMRQPFQVLIGADDEVYYPERFEPEFRQAGKEITVKEIPGVKHADLILSKVALDNIVEALGSLRSRQ